MSASQDEATGKAATQQQMDTEEQTKVDNKRPLACNPSGAHQKRASFSKQRSSNGSGQSSLSSGGGDSLSQRRDSGAQRNRRRARLPPLRRQASSLSSSKQQLADEQQDDEQQEDLLPSSNADYERIRNETLLFFLDRLYYASTEGKEARTLHELSCLFGTPQFTREMRQIVGASRNGLKKFLQTFPSLFHIEGDKVYLSQLKQDAASTARDYNKEATDYFENKLLQFGVSPVPVRNLFGYRSQASQEVRHVSGKNARDFKRFLKANESVFELLADGEHVMLRSVLDTLRQSGDEPNSLLSLQTQSLLQISDHEQQQQQQPTQACKEAKQNDVVAMDPYLNKRFAHLIEQCLRTMQNESNSGSQFKVSIEELHARIKLDCKNELFLKMVSTIDDLRVLLRMHPKLFKRSHDEQGDFVTLLSEQDRRELELASGPASLAHQTHRVTRQHSALESSASQAPVGAKTPLSTQVEVVRPDDQAAPSEPVAGGQRQASRREPTFSQVTNGNKQVPSSKDATKSDTSPAVATTQLRSSAAPFVPHARAAGVHATTHNDQQRVQRSVSNLGPRRGPLMSHHSVDNQNNTCFDRYSNSRRAPQQPVNQRNAIRNYLTQPAAGQHNSNNIHWASSQQANRQAITTHHHASFVSNSDNHQQVIDNAKTRVQPVAIGEDLRARTVDIVREASNIVTRIMNTTDAVAFDCKGYNLGFDGQITLIQFGFLPSKSDDLVAKTIDTLSLNRDIDNNNDDGGENKAPSTKRPKPEVCVFDLITNPELAYCLKPLLESDKIVKIVHDVRNKSNALYVQFNIILNNVFDTQVANLVVQQQDTGKPAYKSRYISMSKLCEVYGDEQLLKYRNIIKSKTRHSLANSNSSSSRLKDVNYWKTRPLTRAMIIESTIEVYCLIDGIYQNLKSKLKPEYEPLFEQLNLEGVLARIKPDEIRSAKKGRKIDLEVIDLKRKLYRDATGPVVLSNREIRLLRHVDLTDEVRQKIQQCKKVAKKLERLDMKAQTQASQTQSPNSQSSERKDRSNDAQSLLSSSSAGDMSLTTTSGSTSSNEQQLVEDQERILTSFMDSSSMFDELKDKMIESSHLLDSIEDSLRTPL